MVNNVEVLPPIINLTDDLPALKTDYTINPAITYINNLDSEKSKIVMLSYLNIIAKLCGYQGITSCPWQLLRYTHVNKIIQSLVQHNKAPSTIRTYLASIKGIAREAFKLKQLSADDYYHIKEIKSPRGARLPKGRALEKSEVKELIFTCESYKSVKGARDTAIIALLAGCGLRRGELVAINREHISIKDKTVKIQGKGNKERLCYIPHAVLLKLQDWIDGVRGDHKGPLFVRIYKNGHVTDERLTGQAIYYILETLQNNLGLEKLTPHDLRRTFATELLDNHEDLITVKDAMGHASITTTEKYDRRGTERVRKAINRLKFIE